jgi:two-component system response regulator NreC
MLPHSYRPLMAAHLHVAPPLPDQDVADWPQSSPVRVVLADDHVPMRRSLRLLLDAEPGMEVVAEAGDHSSAANHVHGYQPDVLVLDLGMRDGSSVEAIRSFSEKAPNTRIVILTMEDNPVFAQRTLTAGAAAFVAKDLADVELPEAIRAVAKGEQYVSPGVASRLDALHRALTDNKITQREVEVLRLIAFGHTSVEIARMLHLSPRTIETHRAHIHKKLGLATRAELVRYALRRGLIGA